MAGYFYRQAQLGELLQLHLQVRLEILLQIEPYRYFFHEYRGLGSLDLLWCMNASWVKINLLQGLFEDFYSRRVATIPQGPLSK